MEHETVGAILRRVRQQNGWSLEELSKRTYIRVTYLSALEEGNDKTIGDPVYVKGFIRKAAAELGLDGAALVREWNREQGGERALTVAKIPEETFPDAPRGRRTGNAARRPFNTVEWTIIAAGTLLLIGFWIWLLYL